MTDPSAASRVRRAWRAVLLSFTLRLSFAATVALVPAAWAGESTRHFPRGELALIDHGGLLLFDVFVHGSAPFGTTRLAAALGVLLAALALVPFGALAFELAQPSGLGRALAQSMSRIGTSLLLTGTALLLLALVVIFETFAFGPVISSFGDSSAWPLVVGLLFALPAPAAVALYGDALRLRGLLADDGFIDRFGATLQSLRPHRAASFARYLGSVLLQIACAAGALLLLFAVMARSTGIFALGVWGALLLLVAAAFVRAWLLGHLAALVSRGPGDVEPLHGSSDVGYEAARSRERPDSSVGRAED